MEHNNIINAAEFFGTSRRKNEKSAGGAKCRQCSSQVSNMMKYGPFCSSRCRSLDLGSWASGDYCIEGNEHVSSESEEFSRAKLATSTDI